MIGDKTKNAMNNQIKNELESFYIYLSMSAYLSAQNLEGMAHWMRAQAHEEMIHAMKFYDHIIDRGGTVTLLDLKQLKADWDSPLDVWKDTLDHEKLITGKIHSLMKIAREENDYASEPLLAWFVNEQIEEEKNAEKILREMEMVGSSKDGLLMLDRELAARVFVVGSPFNPADYKLAT